MKYFLLHFWFILLTSIIVSGADPLVWIENIQTNQNPTFSSKTSNHLLSLWVCSEQEELLILHTLMGAKLWNTVKPLTLTRKRDCMSEPFLSDMRPFNIWWMVCSTERHKLLWCGIQEMHTNPQKFQFSWLSYYHHVKSIILHESCTNCICKWDKGWQKKGTGKRNSEQ